MIRYVLGVAVCGAMIVTFYRSALYGRVSFRVARIFLVGAIVLSAAIPALKIPVWRSAPIEIPYIIELPEVLPEVAAMSVEPAVNWLAIGLWVLYGAGVVAVLAAMGWQAAKIRRLKRTSVIERVGDAQVAVNQQVSAPFSFLGTIFIPPLDIRDARGAVAARSDIPDIPDGWEDAGSAKAGVGNIPDGRGTETGAERMAIGEEVGATGCGAISAQDLGRIVAHERSHVRHRHSAERIAAQVLTAFVWWSPAAWWASRLLAEVHEFEADDDVLRDGCTVDEYLPLIFRQVFGVVPHTAAGMAHSLTKKRFEMMRKSLKHNKLSALKAAGVLPIVGAGLMLFGFTERTPEIVYTDAKTALETTQAPDEPTHQAEVMPRFEGGDLIAFHNWVTRQLVYPKEAMQNDIQGKVSLRFVIDKQGNVSTVEVLASPSELLAAEAVRVVKSSPKWTPATNGGKPVSVFYILPVDFVLQGDPAKNIEVTSSEPLRLGDGVPANFDGLLILVDGKKVKNLDDVDPETVEAIEVLKDAAAVEKFGRRAKDGVISVTLKQEMVDTGYGSIERRRNTGASSTIDMRGAASYNNLKDYIRGRVAGVQFVGDQIVIRGINSINSGIEALVVVDGVAMSSFADANASINPADVASITVLKDAGSTGIYGVRGANGVLLIRTKGGR